ncbi:unnamed protein product, partial [Closterium sp. NIES-53]
DRERYFLLVVDDYTRYTMVFPLRSKGEDLPVLRLHSDRGGEFSSGLLGDFCRGEGILQLFMLLASPQQNGIAKRRIGLVMEVARTSMIHAGAPHFLWPFAVRYAAHQLKLWPRVSLPEISPTLRWTGKVGDASMFRVWGSRAFVRDTSADKLSSRTIPCVFLGFPPDAPGWHFYHPTSCRVLSSQDVTFDESVPFYHPFPYRTTPLPPPAALPCSRSPSSAARGDASGGAASGGAELASAEPGGAESGGAGFGGAEPGGTEPEGAEPGDAESEGAESGGAEHEGTASAGGPAGASPRLSPRREPLSTPHLRKWFAHRTRLRSGAATAGGSVAGGTGAGDARATSLGGAGVLAGVGGAVGGTGAGGAGAGGAGAGDPGAGGARAGGTGAGGAGSGGNGAVDPGAGGAGVRDSPLPAPSPYAEQTNSFTERREPESRPAWPVRALRTVHRVPHPLRPPVPGTHLLALCPSSVPLRVPLLPPPKSSLPAIPDPESDLARTDRPTVPRLLTTVVIDPSFESTTASTLVAELVDFAAACHLDYATALFLLNLSLPVLHPSGTTMDAEMASWKSTGTYVDAVPPFEANIVDGMWIFRGVDFFHTFSPTTKMTTLQVLLHIAAQRDYELHSLDFSTAFLQESLHEEIWLRRPPVFTGSFPAGTQWSLRRLVYGLHQAPREWHDTLRTMLAALGFAPSTAGPSLFLCTDTSLPPFYVLVYVDDLVFATADTEALALAMSELQKRHTCTNLGPSVLRLPVLLTTVHSSAYRSLALSSTFERVLVVIGLHLQPWFRLYFLAVYPLVSVLSSSCEAEIYAGAMAAEDLCWLTYLLTDLGERARSSPQRGQLRLTYVATRANIADIFTKALQSGPSVTMTSHCGNWGYSVGVLVGASSGGANAGGLGSRGANAGGLGSWGVDAGGVFSGGADAGSNGFEGVDARGAGSGGSTGVGTEFGGATATAVAAIAAAAAEAAAPTIAAAATATAAALATVVTSDDWSSFSFD